jgi:hypothetical protein
VTVILFVFVALLASSPHAQALTPPQEKADTVPVKPGQPGADAPPATKAPPVEGQPPETKAPDTKQPGAPETKTTSPTPGTPETKPGQAGSTTGGAPSSAGHEAANGGQGLPPIAVSGTLQVAKARVQVSLDSTADSVPGDFQAGLLVSPQQPDAGIVPAVAVLTDLSGKRGPSPISLDIEVSGLVPFGELTVPLMYKRRQVETLRFRKAGLIVRPPAGGPIMAHEKDRRLLLVLENPSVDSHVKVGVRVRFQDADVCTASGDQTAPLHPAPVRPSDGWWARLVGSTPPGVDCLRDASWATFAIRPSSQVSLLVPTHEAWFLDRLSHLARSTTRQGTLTLRYFNGDDVVAEQNLPLEVQFEPTTGNLAWSIGWIAFYLLVGALLFLLLRVSIPNYRRKKTLKDTLNEARVSTATLSNAVDSQLRVLLRVERLALDQRRREGWVLLPGFAELATRVETGLATLTRKIGLARRLDAATCRLECLLAGPVALTRVDIIERDLAAASDGLKTDQLRDADWLFIQQRLEAADKALNEPSPDEKQAFEALLSHRWQSIRDHFGHQPGQEPNTNQLVVPPELSSMEVCFPRASLLPRTDDDDGRKWIGSMGVVRADLQLTALERLRDVQFLAPTPPSPAWIGAMVPLTAWLATPSIDNLASARRLLQQLSEPTTVKEIVDALQEGRAEIEMDPQCVGPNQTLKLSVRFLDPRLNSANLRDAIQCEWTFDEPTMMDARAQARRHWPRATEVVDRFATLLPYRGRSATPVAQRERGWVVHRYLEAGVERQNLSVGFFRDGRELNIPAEIVATRYRKTVEPSERSNNGKESHEKWLRFGFQTVQMLAALLVPLATLAITTAGDATTGRWWDLVGIGFGSEAIRNILTSEQSTPTT